MDSSRLAALDAEHTNATDLLADDVLPDASMNKRQPHVQQALLDVLTRSMGFEHVDQIILGGTIELDAYNGPVGHRYHVEITPEGGTTIQRDGADVTGSMDDQVATAATAVKIVDVPPTVEHEIASSYNPISQWGPHSIGQPE